MLTTRNDPFFLFSNQTNKNKQQSLSNFTCCPPNNPLKSSSGADLNHSVGNLVPTASGVASEQTNKQAKLRAGCFGETKGGRGEELSVSVGRNALWSASADVCVLCVGRREEAAAALLLIGRRQQR